MKHPCCDESQRKKERGLPGSTGSYLYQFIHQFVQVAVADAAGMEIEVLPQHAAHLTYAAFGGIAIPAADAMGKRVAYLCYVRSDEATHVVTGSYLDFLARKDDCGFRMAGTNHAQGFKPAHSICYYISRCLFFNATVALEIFFVIN